MVCGIGAVRDVESARDSQESYRHLILDEETQLKGISTLFKAPCLSWVTASGMIAV